jgi:alpha-D-ribose 1-methylphosphonate 5-triphosphate synthase subunit PhnH
MGATRYDEVFDSQRHFRELMDATARPGSIRTLEPVALAPEGGLSAGAAALAQTLMDAEVSFAAVGYDGAAVRFLESGTRARTADRPDADFLYFLGGRDAESLALARIGDPAYPETGATVVVDVLQMAAEPFSGAVCLRVAGPGVDGERRLYLSGVESAFLATLRMANQEYPLGVDTYFVCGGQVAAMPRSVSFSWE